MKSFEEPELYKEFRNAYNQCLKLLNGYISYLNKRKNGE